MDSIFQLFDATVGRFAERPALIELRGFTTWSEVDFPRTHTLKVKRPEVLDTLQAMRQEA